MHHIDVERLSRVVAQIPRYAELTLAERAEVLRIASGLRLKESGAAARVSPETIRARRQGIYRKLRVGGAYELVSMLLARTLWLLGAGEHAGTSAQDSRGAAVSDEE